MADNHGGGSAMEELPDEILFQVLSLLPPEDVAACGGTCTRLRAVAEDAHLWRSLCAQRFPIVHTAETDVPDRDLSVGWKDYYVKKVVADRIFRAGEFECVELELDTDRRQILCVDILGDTVAAATQNQSVSIWSAVDRSILRVIPLPGSASVVDLGADGTLVTGTGGAITWWDLETGDEMRSIGQGATFLRRTDDVLVAASGTKVSVFDQRVGSAVATFEGHTGAIYDVDFDADVAVSCGQDGSLRSWDLKMMSAGEVAEVGSMACLQLQGNTVIAGGRGAELVTFDRHSLVELESWQAHTLSVMDLAADASKIVSCDLGGEIAVHDTATHELLFNLPVPEGQMVVSVVVSEDRVVAGGPNTPVLLYEVSPGSRADGGSRSGRNRGCAVS